MIRALPIAATTFVIAIACLGSSASQVNADQLPVFDPEKVQMGRRLYVKHCSHCHGFNMVNPGTVSFDLRKFPKDDQERFFESVKEGKNTMPAWKDSLSDDAIHLLWSYVRTGGKQ
ncbi:MAG: Cytochrome c6 precursor [Pseudomonadota bacterium]|jgi:mono/diheme cytochrome c family protein